MDVQKRLEWLTKALSVSGRTLTLEDTRHTVAEWDSMGDLMLLSGLEEEFGIVMSADDLSTVASAAELFTLLERKYAFPPG